MTCYRQTFFVLISATLLLAGSVVCQAGTLGKQLRSSLNNAAVSTELPVIITFSDKVTPLDFLAGSPRQRRDELVRAMRRKAKDTQQPLKDFLRSKGIKKIKSLWIINGLAIEARPELIKQLSQWPGVAEVRINGTITVPEVLPQALAGTAEWNIAAVGADQLWDMGMTGAGVVVATLDTGVDGFHPDLQSKWRGWSNVPCEPLINSSSRDWFDPYGEHPNCPYDKDGHGTGVMGIIAGGDNGGTAIGVAPDASWIAAKIFNDAGSADFAAIHSAFQWVLDPDGNGDTSDAPDIVNNSWGLEGPDTVNQCIDEFQSDIQLLKAVGIAVVFSGGNAGPDPSSSVSPANHPESIAVGSTNQVGALSDSSGRGPSPCPSAEPIFPQLVAPGVGVKTTDLSFGGVVPDSYMTATGSSFAAPHVSGIVALLLEPDGFPATTVPDLERALELSASDLGVEGPDNDFGYGLINSLAAARHLAGLPHLAVYDPKPPEHDLVLDFGSTPSGTAVVHPVVIRNSGGGILMLSANDWSTLNPSFTVISDMCSGVDLASDEDCRLSVQFSPVADGLFNENLSIYSNDPDQNPITVSLIGTGNNPPYKATLLFPLNGATDQELTVTFQWIHPADPDGDQVTDTVLISESTPAPVGTSTMSALISSGPGLPSKSSILLCMAILLMILFGRNQRIRFFTILAVGIILLNSCGGGGGGTPATNSTFTTTGLKSGTTYSWKVVSDDGAGGVTESSVWNFTTK